MYRLLIIDNEKLARDKLKKCIDWKSMGIGIIEEAENGSDALQIIKRSNPEIVITEIRMSGIDGIKLMQIIKETKLDCKVVVLSDYAEFKYVQQALTNEAVGYLLKPVQSEDLIKTIKTCISKINDERKRNEEVGSFVYDTTQLSNCIKIGNKKGIDLIFASILENSIYNYRAIDRAKLIILYVLDITLKMLSKDSNISYIINKKHYDIIATVNREKTYFDIIKGARNLLLDLSDMIEFGHDKGRQKIINKIKELIENKYSEDISLIDAAESVFLTPSYVSKMFIEETGESFSQYLISIRVYCVPFVKDNLGF